VTHGQTVGLLEVMKTFNRLVYQGDGLPTHATVERILPKDGDDVVRGDPILLLDSAES
jgi:acetyl-CoA carboxylase biotin carboxyl carrier protein